MVYREVRTMQSWLKYVAYEWMNTFATNIIVKSINLPKPKITSASSELKKKHNLSSVAESRERRAASETPTNEWINKSVQQPTQDWLSRLDVLKEPPGRTDRQRASRLSRRVSRDRLHHITIHHETTITLIYNKSNNDIKCIWRLIGAMNIDEIRGSNHFLVQIVYNHYRLSSYWYYLETN